MTVGRKHRNTEQRLPSIISRFKIRRADLRRLSLIIPQEKTPCVVVSYAKERDVKQEELEGQNREGEGREGGVKDSRLPRSAWRVAPRK